jgi:hypothetical protein
MILDPLWRLRWKRDRMQRRYDRHIRKAEKKNDHDERDSLISEVMMERQLYNDDISSAESIELRRKAEALGIPVPPFSDKVAWETGYNPAISFLSARVRMDLRTSIRKERRDRWDFAILLLKDLLAPIVAILATIVNLILVLKLRH